MEVPTEVGSCTFALMASNLVSACLPVELRVEPCTVGASIIAHVLNIALVSDTSVYLTMERQLFRLLS